MEWLTQEESKSNRYYRYCHDKLLKSVLKLLPAFPSLLCYIYVLTIFFLLLLFLSLTIEFQEC